MLKLSKGAFTNEALQFKLGVLQKQAVKATMQELAQFKGNTEVFNDTIKTAVATYDELKREHKEALKELNKDQQKSLLENANWELYDKAKSTLEGASQTTLDNLLFKHAFVNDIIHDGVNSIQLYKINGANLIFDTIEDNDDVKKVKIVVQKFVKTLTAQATGTPKVLGTAVFTNREDYIPLENEIVVKKSFQLEANMFDPLINKDKDLYNLCIQCVQKIKDERVANRNASLTDITKGLESEIEKKVDDIRNNLESIKEALKYYNR